MNLIKRVKHVKHVKLQKNRCLTFQSMNTLTSVHNSWIWIHVLPYLSILKIPIMATLSRSIYRALYNPDCWKSTSMTLKAFPHQLEHQAVKGLLACVQHISILSSYWGSVTLLFDVHRFSSLRTLKSRVALMPFFLQQKLPITQLCLSLENWYDDAMPGFHLIRTWGLQMPFV
ncbi:MAG: hypothetical protein Sylvanvirus14_1, partial [Sylvanvirus sp.]